jgi:hypothetical protein
MSSRHRRLCPLCNGLAPCRQLAGEPGYTEILCPRCGTFRIEPTLPLRPWAQLAPEEIRLVVYLPGHIRRQNAGGQEPLLTLENWQDFARRGRAAREASDQPAH